MKIDNLSARAQPKKYFPCRKKGAGTNAWILATDAIAGERARQALITRAPPGFKVRLGPSLETVGAGDWPGAPPGDCLVLVTPEGSQASSVLATLEKSAKDRLRWPVVVVTEASISRERERALLRAGALEITLWEPSAVLLAVENAYDRFVPQGAGTEAGDGLFRVICEAMPKGFVVGELVQDGEGKPEDFRYLWANEAYKDGSGGRFTREDSQGRLGADIAPEVRDLWVPFFAEVARSGKPGSKTSYSPILGRWLRVEAYSLGQGRFAYFHQDVTDQIRAEEALRQSEYRLSRVFATNLLGILYWDMQGAVRAANDEFLRIVGHDREDLHAGRLNWVAMTPSEYKTQDAEALAEFHRAGFHAPIEKEYIRKDGGRCWVLVGSSATGDGFGVGFVLDISARKRAEEALRTSEEKYRGILASMDEGFCILQMIFDPAGRPADYRWLETNAAFERQSGLKDVVGKTMRQLVPDLDESWARLYGKVALTGEPIRFENFAPAMGRWFDVYAHRVGMPEERKVALIFKDTTADKKAEEALKVSERFTRRVLDNLFAFVGVMDLDGTLLEANRAPLDAVDIALEDIRGKKIWETRWIAYDPAVQARMREACARAASGEVVRFDLSLRLAGDRRAMVDFQVAPLKDADGRTTHLIPSAVDITDRSRMERELHKFALLVEASNDFIAIADFHGRISFLNAGGRDLVGDPRRALEISLADMVLPEDASILRKALGTALSAGSWQGEFRFRHAALDAPIPVSCNLFPLKTPETGAAFALAMVARDLTQVREKEEQLRQSQKVEAIGHLAGGVAHDFNNILTAINGYSDMLLESTPKDDPKYEFLWEIHTSGLRAASLTSQLLAYSRKQVMQPKVIQLNGVVEESIRLFRRLLGENIEFKVDLDPALLPIKADPNKLQQILLNLCLNARDAMPDGGRLTIKTRNQAVKAARRIPGLPGRPGPYAVLEVVDTGIGMSPELQARIFEPFFTTKEVGKGTGLGLSSVEGIVKQSDGTVQVESGVGKGSTFRIYLPALEKEEKRAEEAALAKQVIQVRREGSILLAEDEETVRKFTRTLLEREGYSVLEARDGVEALALFDSPDVDPDLILSDVIMPRMGGTQLATEIRRRRADIPILLMSGYTREALSGQFALVDSIHLIQKPFSPAALSGKIQELLASRQRT